MVTRGRCRLVGDEERGAAGEGHRDHHPLPHAAGELVRVGVDVGLGEGMPTRRKSSRARS